MKKLLIPLMANNVSTVCSCRKKAVRGTVSVKNVLNTIELVNGSHIAKEKRIGRVKIKKGDVFYG